jgi:hypothetical protein
LVITIMGIMFIQQRHVEQLHQRVSNLEANQALMVEAANYQSQNTRILAESLLTLAQSVEKLLFRQHNAVPRVPTDLPDDDPSKLT